MKKRKPPFQRFWYVTEQDRRTNGVWTHEYDFKPGEWVIAFFDDGYYGEIFRPAGVPEEKTIGRWNYDEDSGVISVEFLAEGSFVQKYVFEGEYLYEFGDESHIPLRRRTIIAHHAHVRYRLTKI